MGSLCIDCRLVLSVVRGPEGGGDTCTVHVFFENFYVWIYDYLPTFDKWCLPSDFFRKFTIYATQITSCL